MTLGAAKVIFGAASLLIFSGVTAAQGSAACTATPLGSTVVRILDRVPLVTASANGKPVIFALDTGAQQTALTGAAAERIGAETPKVEFSRQMRGIANSAPTREVELRSFVINGIAIHGRRVRVIPPITSLPADGLFGIDSLGQFDIDFDMPQGRVVLYQPRSCDTPPNWPRPYETLEVVGLPGSLLQFPVQLDGRKITAAIDTGTQRTTLTAKTAAELGVTDSVLAKDRAITVQGAAAEKIGSHIHQFSQLRIGDLLITNPDIVVSNVNFRGADMLLGMDLLSTRRFWISHTARRIFIAK
jgi:predicted aspartyl protease